MSTKKSKTVIFRGRKKDNGKWIEGFYIFDKRSSEHLIKEWDKEFEIYRDSLQVKVKIINKDTGHFQYIFKDIDTILNHF